VNQSFLCEWNQKRAPLVLYPRSFCPTFLPHLHFFLSFSTFTSFHFPLHLFLPIFWAISFYARRQLCMPSLMITASLDQMPSLEIIPKDIFLPSPLSLSQHGTLIKTKKSKILYYWKFNFVQSPVLGTLNVLFLILLTLSRP
jgi:hypothetical protein